jgi:hypothetical protein
MKYCLLEKMGCEAVGLIHLAWCRIKWQAYVNMINILCFQCNIFKLKNQEIIEFWEQEFDRIYLKETIALRCPFLPLLSRQWVGIAQSVQRLATGWTTRGRSSSPCRVKNFLSTSSKPALGSTQPIQWVSETLFPGVKQPGTRSWPLTCN